MTTLKSIDVKQLKQWLDRGEAILVDVREPSEHAAEHIDIAKLAPLSEVTSDALRNAAGKIVVFHCRSGMRTQTNAAKLAACAAGEAFYLKGGIEAWKAAGLPVQRR
ncbi:MAG: hypothetical protein HY054_05305 [Proteobacteria bacterium]|nr:hypothetical protein [Pseudomonadota bacterium]